MKDATCRYIVTAEGFNCRVAIPSRHASRFLEAAALTRELALRVGEAALWVQGNGPKTLMVTMRKGTGMVVTKHYPRWAVTGDQALPKVGGNWYAPKEEKDLTS